VGERHRPIRARSAPGQVAGAATEKHGLEAHRPQTACPTAFSTQEPLCPVPGYYASEHGIPAERIFMPRNAEGLGAARRGSRETTPFRPFHKPGAGCTACSRCWRSRRTAVSSSYPIEQTPTSGCICSSTPSTDARAIPAALPSPARGVVLARANAALSELSDSPGRICCARSLLGTGQAPFSASGSSKPLRSDGATPYDPLARLELVGRRSVRLGVGRGV
jgi:hypothetical protein